MNINIFFIVLFNYLLKLAIGFSDWNTYCGLAHKVIDAVHKRRIKYV